MKTKLLTIAVLLTIALILTPLLPALAANALLNPGFESGDWTDADNWAEYNFQRTNGGARSGDWGMEYSGNASNASVIQNITIATGTIYFSAWVNVSTGGSAFIYYSTGTPDEEGFAFSALNNEWEYISGSGIITDGNVEFSVVGHGDGETVIAYKVDDVCVSTIESDCAEEQPTNTPTATSTETQTPTPTGTFTLTYTPTFTETLTPTSTATETATPTITNTPTFTRTLMPGPAQTATYEAAVADYIAIGRSQMPVSITVLGLCLVVVLVVIVGGMIWIVSKNRR